MLTWPRDMTERYTPGHSENAVEFMSRRTLASHGEFLVPYLSDDVTVLDCGCGPGTITCDIASNVSKGRVVGVDADPSQVALATGNAAKRRLTNIEFRTASVYELPFEDGSFDLVFAHGLIEHLNDPPKAVGELRRVLRPAGVLALCSPDWGGFLLAPPREGLTEAIEAYKALQTRNGGDVYGGRKLAGLLSEAGFGNVDMKARYEVYESIEFIGEYLAVQLEDAGESEHASTLRHWATEPNGMFAQAWVSSTGRKAQ